MGKRTTSIITLFVVLLVAGGVMLYMGLKDKRALEGELVDFNEISYSELEDGMYVEGELYATFGYFAEDYETTYGIRFDKDSKALYYIIPIGNDEDDEIKYAGYKCGQDKFAELDALTDETWNWWVDETGEAVLDTEIPVVCKVEKMNEDFIGYYKEFFKTQWPDMTDDEIEQIACYYTLVNVAPDAYKFTIILGGVLVGLGAVLLLITIFTGKKKKQEDVYY